MARKKKDAADPFGDKAFVEEIGGTKKRKPRAARKTKVVTLPDEPKPSAEAAKGEEAPSAMMRIIHAAPGRSRGRPTAYKPEYAKQAEMLCRLGATDEELAAFFEVNRETIRRWSHAHEEFCGAMKSGKEHADERVERSLYARATGYTYDAVRIFMPAGASAPVYAEYQEHVPPDTAACFIWLKNRRPDLWRDKREVNHSGAIGRAGDLTDDQLARIIAEGSGDGTDTPPAGASDPDRVH